jgi:hypothetical protein
VRLHGSDANLSPSFLSGIWQGISGRLRDYDPKGFIRRNVSRMQRQCGSRGPRGLHHLVDEIGDVRSRVPVDQEKAIPALLTPIQVPPPGSRGRVQPVTRK